MNRRRLWMTSIAAFLAKRSVAQVSQQSSGKNSPNITDANDVVITDGHIKGGPPPRWRSGNKLNNQCPICGTVASKGLMEGYKKLYKALGFHLPLRCTLCNAAFWNDAE